MKEETKFKINRVLPALKQFQIGGRIWWLVTQEMAHIGIPDILLCFNGVMFAFELKVSADPDIKQLQELYNINQAGGVALILCPDNLEEVIRRMEQCEFVDRALIYAEFAIWRVQVERELRNFAQKTKMRKKDIKKPNKEVNYEEFASNDAVIDNDGNII